MELAKDSVIEKHTEFSQKYHVGSMRNHDTMISNIVLILIIGSACCVVFGGLMTAIRVVKLVRGARAVENKIWAYLQIEEVRPCGAQEDAETTLNSVGK